MIDPSTETPLTLSQAAKTLPHLRRDRPVHSSTLWRWAKHGIRGHRLEVMMVGGTACTSAAALQRFFAKLSEAAEAAR
jgi:hypothetical protein